MRFFYSVLTEKALGGFPDWKSAPRLALYYPENISASFRGAALAAKPDLRDYLWLHRSSGNSVSLNAIIGEFTPPCLEMAEHDVTPPRRPYVRP